MAAYRNVTPHDRARTATSLAEARRLPIERAIAFAVSDPGAFLPRRMTGRKGGREYEHVSAWGARACALVVKSHGTGGAHALTEQEES